ncbi:hypothetical protein QMA10_15935 [Arthrobacter sp. APC 3897]|uniref:hypothetical protein n=1 Tax=Arthrobacter sp. APC 3897 TaxID=3035204 RepID=UPI0025B4D22E|nr:hypothetical protein [Arthrobacter sp. APC 3897]MDN3483404.1 hypothetical protein [Arthrobacter sp. APC 3897]
MELQAAAPRGGLIVTETGRLKILAIQQFLEELHARNGLASMNNTYTKTGYRITHAQGQVNELGQNISEYFRECFARTFWRSRPDSFDFCGRYLPRIITQEMQAQ